MMVGFGIPKIDSGVKQLLKRVYHLAFSLNSIILTNFGRMKRCQKIAKTGLFYRLFPKAREYAAQAVKICADANGMYAECAKLQQLQRAIPAVIGGKKKRR